VREIDGLVTRESVLTEDALKIICCVLLLTPSVLLRQNPHNVHEWLKRVKLFEGKPREVGLVMK